ncbi:uncharacterized protein LOC105831305 [Monomorium pharaonis]|uniref:uncharacterized protein LOC105831305 n=1 Tax=Monomorium pharaonis TaxID=307658 RepID=UPI00063F6C85|nr:uncharacterized protein LOC105831305 [Monomorium pharaonis]
MEAVLHQQKLLLVYISRMWANLLKFGQARITPTEIRNRLSLLDDYWKRFQNNHFKLAGVEGLVATEYAKTDFFTTTEETFFQMRAKLQNALMEHESNARDAELPRVGLPKFLGDQLAWEGFRDLFRSLVHDVDLSDVQKLQYLKSCLSGEAADVLTNVPISEAAYQGAWADLMKTYDNPRVLLFSHMRNLLKCTPITKPLPTELKRLLGFMTTSIRAFFSLGRPVEHWDDWFVHLLVGKLDFVTRLLWETSLKDSRAFPTFKELRAFLENRIRALEAADLEALPPCPASVPKAAKKSPVLSHATGTGRTTRGKCALCAGAHTVTDRISHAGLVC